MKFWDLHAGTQFTIRSSRNEVFVKLSQLSIDRQVNGDLNAVELNSGDLVRIWGDMEVSVVKDAEESEDDSISIGRHNLQATLLMRDLRDLGYIVDACDNYVAVYDSDRFPYEDAFVDKGTCERVTFFRQVLKRAQKDAEASESET